MLCLGGNRLLVGSVSQLSFAALHLTTRRASSTTPRAAHAAFSLLPAPAALAFPSSSARLFASPVDFLLGAASSLQFPKPPALGSIAFAGRSNVGKSSLINAIFRNNSLARVSATPGRTQQLNFFKPKEADFHVVDMPGYGFAASASKANAASWQSLVGDYLREQSGTLKCVYVLVDSRRGLQESDVKFMSFLDESETRFQIVLTKLDQISSRDYAFLVDTFQLYFNGAILFDKMQRLHRSIEKGGAHAVASVAEAKLLNANRVAAALAGTASDGASVAPVPASAFALARDKLVFPSCSPYVIVTCAESGFGLPEVRGSITMETGVMASSGTEEESS
jgi:GTP-binding protein